MKLFCEENNYSYKSIMSGYYINKNKKYKGWIIEHE